MPHITVFNLKKALKEAAEWDRFATKEERTEISYAEAREAVLERIRLKYQSKKE